MRNLIITADDCGLSQGINTATASLYEKGMVTTASVMTNFEASRHALELFARSPGLDLGVHLNLTDGFSLAIKRSLPGLTDMSGRFYGRKALFSHAVIADRAFLESARAELAAQIDFFLEYGVKPRHLTSHFHFHSIPALRRIMCELAREYAVEWVRNFRLRRTVIPYNVLLTTSKEDAVESACAIASPDYVVGLRFWMRYGRPQRLLNRLLQLEGTLELVVHPSLEHDLTYPRTVTYPPQSRFREMRYFEKFTQLLRAENPENFRLTTMRATG